MKQFLTIILAAIAVSGCIYPFDLDESFYEGGLVVEGDILVGGVTHIKLSTVQPLSGVATGETPQGVVWVEDENGREYRDAGQLPGSSFSIDMSDAPSNVRYCLRIRLSRPVQGSSSTDFRTDWLVVQKAPSIDSIEYDNDGQNVNVRFSLSSPDGSGCFRWDYEEIWEFHAAVHTDIMYNYGKGTYSEYSKVMEFGNPYYWCWGYASSTQAGIAIAKSTGGERLVDRPLLSIPRTSEKLQQLYYVKIIARDISEECYEYLHTIQVNSTSTGSLTTPDPSQIVGNIRSDSDSTEVVLGYIEACSVATKELFIDNKFYRQPPFTWETQTLPNDTAVLDFYYRNNFRPFEMNPGGGDNPTYNWGPQRCLDCVAAGGTKNKPDFWPTTHR